MLKFTDRNLKTVQDARNLKAKQIRTARKYLSVAKRLGLSEKSTSVKHWTQVLEDWRFITIEAIVNAIEKSRGGVS